MSGDVVNLRRARKAAQRGKAEAQAAQNRAAFGLSAAERARLEGGEAARGVQQLDQHKLTSAPVDETVSKRAGREPSGTSEPRATDLPNIRL